LLQNLVDLRCDLYQYLADGITLVARLALVF
jgi:hypothetical protein